jgi:hypothetical protein
MIKVPDAISPTVTDFSNKKSRVRVRTNADSKKLRELLAKKNAGQHNILDSETRIEMVLAGKDFPADADVEGEITRLRLSLDACVQAEESLKVPLAKAKYEAATAVLIAIKPEQDKVVSRLLAALVKDFTPAYLELFQLSRDLKDKDCGWRNGVCDLVPKLVELFGPPTSPHSPLASLLQEAVRCNYLKASDLPKGLV